MVSEGHIHPTRHNGLTFDTNWDNFSTILQILISRLLLPTSRVLLNRAKSAKCFNRCITWVEDCSGAKMAKDRQKFRWSTADARSVQNHEPHDPLAGSTQAKGIVVEKVGIEAKQPNSGIEKLSDFSYQKR